MGVCAALVPTAEAAVGCSQSRVAKLELWRERERIMHLVATGAEGTWVAHNVLNIIVHILLSSHHNHNMFFPGCFVCIPFNRPKVSNESQENGKWFNSETKIKLIICLQPVGSLGRKIQFFCNIRELLSQLIDFYLMKDMKSFNHLKLSLTVLIIFNLN